MRKRLEYLLSRLTTFSLSLLKVTLKALGTITLAMIILAFTDLPYEAYHKLGRTEIIQKDNIQNIIMLGGDGMPSPSTLIRVYYAKQLGNNNPEANVYIALPRNEDGSTEQLSMIEYELVKSGIDRSRIFYEADGYNTFSQAQNLSKMIKDKNETALIITSPEHMHRAILTFQKQGFKSLASFPTFEIPSDASQLIEKDKKGRKKSGNLSLRYNVWSYLIYEIKVMREYTALAYYKIKGNI